MLGVLGCPNLPLAALHDHNKHSPQSQIGCLFSAKLGAGTYIELLDGSAPAKVSVSNIDIYI